MQNPGDEPQALLALMLTKLQELAEEPCAGCSRDTVTVGVVVPALARMSLLPGAAGRTVTFNRRLQRELLNGELFSHIDELRYVVDRWRMDYNSYRPHSPLGYVSRRCLRRRVGKETTECI